MPKPIASHQVAKYFPLANGKYEIKPGLFTLKQDFGNKDQDKLIFQIDKKFSLYRKNKLNAHNEQLSKYFCTENFSIYQQQFLTRYIINTLCYEYPEYFIILQRNNNQLFKCKLTNEEILISDKFDLINSGSINYSNLLDAVIMQIQEDIAIISEDDQISCLHLMAPNFWSASDKIGKSFSEIHQEVAGIDAIIKNSKAILQAMIHKGPYVRFAWGICTDNELNHHSTYHDPTMKINVKSEHGRKFDQQKPSLYLRVERQTISGLPEIKCAMFTIRSYLYNIAEFDKIEVQKLINAINSMTKKQLNYKGLITTKSAIIKWLSSLL